MTAAAPSSVAAMLVSHGDRAGEDRNATLRALAAATSELTGLGAITAGVLKGEPLLEDALKDARASGAVTLLVYPLFMADGYFVRKILRERIDAAGVSAMSRILAPLGVDPGLPQLMLNEALRAAATAGFEPSASRLLIVGHGSKIGPASATATRQAAARVAIARRFARVTTAFLEEDPFIEDTLRDTSMPTVVSGFFVGDGMHAGEDVPDAIAETGANAVYAGPIGSAPGIPTLIAAAINAALADLNVAGGD